MSILREAALPLQAGRTPEGDRLLELLLEAVCPVPVEGDAVLVDRLWDRFCQADLSRMTPAELAAEERRVELRALLDPAPPYWLVERLSAIRKEGRRRV